MSLYFSAASERNKQPIAQALATLLPDTGQVLEIASGGGQHVAYFAGAFPSLQWLPSEADVQLHSSITGRTRQLENVAQPLLLDVCQPWPPLQVDAVLVANLFHISPLATVSGFFQGAAEVLQPGGLVHVYGPFKQDGRHTSEGNLSFDGSLRQRNADWGIRDLEYVQQVAQGAGFADAGILAMPANNLSLCWRLG